MPEDDAVKRIPISELRQEPGAQQLAESADMEPYLNFAVALTSAAELIVATYSSVARNRVARNPMIVQKDSQLSTRCEPPACPSVRASIRGAAILLVDSTSIVGLTPAMKGCTLPYVGKSSRRIGNSARLRLRCWTVFGQGEPCHESKGVVYSIVCARRKLNAVTGITSGVGGMMAAEFNWEYVLTDDGKVFADSISTSVRQGQAAFQLYDDGWRITQIALGN